MTALRFTGFTVTPLLVCFLFLSLANDATAQAVEGADPISKDASTLTPVQYKLGVDKIVFHGGTLGSFIRQVRNTRIVKGFSPTPNIVLSSQAFDYPIPSIEVVTNIDGVLGMLPAVANGELRIQGDDTSNTTVITVVRNRPIEVMVLNVRKLLDSVEREKLLSAIEIGLELQGGPSSDITMKLHEETSILFVRGTDDQRQLVTDIVEALGEGASIAHHQGLIESLGLGGAAGFGGAADDGSSGSSGSVEDAGSAGGAAGAGVSAGEKKAKGAGKKRKRAMGAVGR